MRRPPLPRRENSPVAMTSMIDVVFLLLIFFAVTGGSGVREYLMPTRLAASGNVESVAPPGEAKPQQVEIWLKLTRDAAAERTLVDMNGTSYADLAVLKEQLRALAELEPDNPIVLDVAAEVPLGDLVDLYDTCQTVGFRTINFAAKAALPVQGMNPATGPGAPPAS